MCEAACDCVLPSLYLGDVDAACNTEELKSLGVTHILTLNREPLPESYTNGFQYCFVYALDQEDFNLLSNIEKCLAFITQGRQSGGILVHCFAGQSRAASVVTAYVMSELHLPLAKALEYVKEKRPQIGPNPGFLSQLELFESMGCVIAPSHPAYKVYLLGQLAAQVSQGKFADGIPEEALNFDSSSANQTQEPVYKCRKCRRMLFRQSSLLPHQSGQGEHAFSWAGHHRALEDGQTCDADHFVAPVEWMRDSIVEQQGKLSCPKCQAKLGSFKWFGEPCSCGTWVTPSFHISKTKVDKCKPPGLPATGPRVAAHPLTAQPAPRTPVSTHSLHTNMEDS